MEGLIVLLVLGFLLTPVVALIVALVARAHAVRLEQRVSELEQQLMDRPRRPAPAVEMPASAPKVVAAPAPPPPLVVVPPVAPPPAATPPSVPPAAPTTPVVSPVEPPVGAPVPKSSPPAASPLFSTVTPSPNFEEFLGKRLFVWVGAVAIALGAIFLVSYLVGPLWARPEFRVAAGIGLGVVLLALGEKWRKGLPALGSGATAAGVAALFAAFYAATTLYHLIPTLVGFALLGLTAVTAVFLSLRQGPLVAVLGLVGGFLTPALVSTGSHNLVGLLSYVFLLQLAIFAVTRKTGWLAIAAANVAAGLLWVVVWLVGPFQLGDGWLLGLFLAASSGATVLALGRERLLVMAQGGAEPGDARELPEGASLILRGALLGALGLMATVVGRGGYELTDWAFVGLLTAACLALARLRQELHDLAWLAAGLVIGLLVWWGADLATADAGRFVTVVLGAGALLVVVPYALHFRAPDGPRWAVLASVSSVVLYVLTFLTLRQEVHQFAAPWGLVALGLGALAVLAARPLARRRAAGGSAVPLAALAVAATSFSALAVPVELEGAWWSLAWALEVPALLWLAQRFDLPILGRLGLGLAGAVVARLCFNPFVLRYPVGDDPLFHALIPGYGVPVAAFALAVRLAWQRGSKRQATALEGATVALATAGLALWVHQYFHPGDLERGRLPLAEAGWTTTLWLALALWVADRGLRWERRGLQVAALGVTVLAGLQALLQQLVEVNPLFVGREVGATPVVNALLPAYGLPALLLGFGLVGPLARVENWLAKPLRIGLGAWAIGLLGVWVSLSVRQAFHGSLLYGHEVSNAESYAYSAAWVLLGTALLVAGIWRRAKGLRLGGLAVMTLAVGKVFLFDVGGLGGIFRVLSFLGIGVSLFFLGYLYQRFVFRDEASEQAPDLPS